MKFLIVATCVLLLATDILANPTATKDNGGEQQSSAFAHCLETDSISCLQLTLFRKARSVFENPQIDLFGGVSLIKGNEGRQGKSLDENARAVEAAATIEARNSEIGTYMLSNAKNFFAERSLNLNFANAARSLARVIPDDIKADLRELVVESRTKKKKLKKFLPLLLGVGAKVAILGVGGLFGLLFLAKKALVISIIAFVLALVVGASSGLGRLSGGSGGLLGGLGGLFGGGKNSGNAAGSSGWSSGGAGGGGWSSGSSSGWDTHGAYSSPVAQTIAYSGYKQARR